MSIKKFKERNRDIVHNLQFGGFPHTQTFKKLCEFVDKNRDEIPEDAILFVERVEDSYMNKPGIGWQEHCILDFPDELPEALDHVKVREYLDKSIEAEKSGQCKWFGEYFNQFLNASDINYFNDLNAVILRVHY